MSEENDTKEVIEPAMAINGKQEKEVFELLRRYVERIEILEDQKKEVGEQIKEVFDEAKAHGFDTTVMKKVMQLKKIDKDKRQEMEFLIERYKEALSIE